MDEKNKMTEEELNDVAGGRKVSGHGYALVEAIGFYLTACEKSPNAKHFYEPVGSKNLIWKFNILECKCKYCGKTSHELSCDPIFH